MRDHPSLFEVNTCKISQGTWNLASEEAPYISALTVVRPSSSVMSTWGPGCILSMLVCILVDGDTVVTAVEVVAIEVDDVAVDSDAVEMLEMADLADLAEDTDIFFLALLDCME